MRIGLAADHEGFELKEQIRAALGTTDFEVSDCGAFSLNPGDDYPDFIIPLARGVAGGEMDRGIAICGSGVGACIAANKVRNARAGLIHDVFSARQGVEDDNMNIICLGARLVEFQLAWEWIQAFLGARFKAETRFKRRLEKIAQIEEMEIQQ